MNVRFRVALMLCAVTNARRHISLTKASVIFILNSIRKILLRQLSLTSVESEENDSVPLFKKPFLVFPRIDRSVDSIERVCRLFLALENNLKLTTTIHGILQSLQLSANVKDSDVLHLLEIQQNQMGRYAEPTRHIWTDFARRPENHRTEKVKSDRR